MKWIANKAFPHPVLLASPEHPLPDRDYRKRDFQASLTVAIESDDNEVEIGIKCLLSEQSLVDLIAQNKAKYATEIHCRDTYLRRLLVSESPEFSTKFKKGELHQRVEISSYVVCIEPIQGHKSDTIHPEFGPDAQFNFDPGDVLAACFPEAYWVVPNSIKFSSIFELMPNPSQGENFTVSWEETSRIQIIMNPLDISRFKSLHGNNDILYFLASSVYLSALVQTLRVMESDKDEHVNKKWFKAISQKMSDKGIKPSLQKDDFLDKAQELLDYPVHKMLMDKED